MNICIGHYTDQASKTGCTVFVFKSAARIGIDIRGSNTATFNTAAYDTKASDDSVHAIVLTGGSTYGLESVFGVLEYLEEHKIGYKTRVALVPSVTGAVIYDLAEGSSSVRPGKMAGYIAASDSVIENPLLGSIGVGTGATTGKWMLGRKQKGGFNMAETYLPNGVVVRAYVVTNAVGDIISDTGELKRKRADFKALSEFPNRLEGTINPDRLNALDLGASHENTTLAVIATNANLDKGELQKVAELAQDGMARSIYPVHTNMDGDVIFAVSVGPRIQAGKLSRVSLVDFVGMAAADVLSEAIEKSITY